MKGEGFKPSGFSLQGLAFRVWGLWFKVLGLRVKGSGIMVGSKELRALGYRV